MVGKCQEGQELKATEKYIMWYWGKSTCAVQKFTKSKKWHTDLPISVKKSLTMRMN